MVTQITIFQYSQVVPYTQSPYWVLHMKTREHKDTRQRVSHRLKIARGQLDKVIEMVEEDKYCVDVINQSRAIQNALREIDYLLLENHLQTCVVKFAKDGNTKESVEEIMLLFRNHDK